MNNLPTQLSKHIMIVIEWEECIIPSEGLKKKKLGLNGQQRVKVLQIKII